MIEIKVDKKTELLGVMLLISKYKDKYPFLVEECGNKEYRNKIFASFKKFNNEKTIVLLNEIIDNLCFNYDAPVFLINQLNEDYSFNYLPDYPFKSRLQSSPVVIEFLNSIKRFAKKIEFDKFYESNMSFYKIGINQINNLIKNYNFVEFFKDFYKFDFSNVKFIINLMFFATNGNYGTNFKNDFVCNQCLRTCENNTINFIDSIDNTLTLYVHEFSHSVINPLTEKYSKLTLKNFENIKDKMIKLQYNNADVIIDEHIIRGIELVFLKYYYKTNDGINYVEKWKKEYEFLGFEYIGKVFEKIDYYFMNKDKFKNFEEYFPQILKVFEKN